ncbi:MAG: hypothetical protein KBS95_03285 [Alistipes sp.]|nr:hypothetical protein [Candidatus Alistipes equi]
MTNTGNTLQRIFKFLVALYAVLLCVSVSSQTITELVGRRALRSERIVVNQGIKPKIDSLARFRADSIRIMTLRDSLLALPSDSLKHSSDSIRYLLPDSLRKRIFPTAEEDSLARIALLSKDSLRALRRKIKQDRMKAEGKTPFISDSMSISKVCWASLIMPGFGQIYNKQYWKLPILYGTVGASLGMFFYENNKYKPLKQRVNYLLDQGLSRTRELNDLQSRMVKYNTLREVFLITAIASYVYFIGDAAVKYSTNEVSSVKKATTMACICPGAGQIYNKSYWRAPIVWGGLASTIYCIDWNNRGYDRFKRAYRLKFEYDEHPEKYPDGSPDEFKGRYSTSFLKNLRNSYRRNRDLCIIITAALYVLQIVDAHTDAHLRDYDISDNLSVNVSPMFDLSYNPAFHSNTASFGMNLSFSF